MPRRIGDDTSDAHGGRVAPLFIFEVGMDRRRPRLLVLLSTVTAFGPACFTAHAVVQRERVHAYVDRVAIERLEGELEGDNIALVMTDGTLRSFAAGRVGADETSVLVLDQETRRLESVARRDVRAIELETLRLVRTDEAHALEQDTSVAWGLGAGLGSLLLVTLLVAAACADGCFVP